MFTVQDASSTDGVPKVILAVLSAIRYAVYAGDPWPTTTVLRVSSADGAFVFEQAFADAEPHGDHAVFTLSRFPQNGRYSAQLVVGDRVFSLFSDADLTRLASPDAYNLLPATADVAIVNP